MAFLLDTSVYSQVLKRHPVAAALDRWQRAGDSDCRVSMVSVAELEWGLHHENNPQR